jgi:hypothetical protein
MADESVQDQIKVASAEAKLELLQAIKKQASSTNNAGTLQALGYAYALTVGASVTHLPGGPTAVNVSK